MSREPQRRDGYAPIRDYAIVGNKRTAALIALDGSVDWLCPTGFDSPSAFGALLDTERGGSCELRPAIPFGAERRYLPGTNVLETTFSTAEGTVRVTDAMSMPDIRPVAFNELVRVVEALDGAVPMRWHVHPRFDYGHTTGRTARHLGVPTISSPDATIAVQAHGVGEPEQDDEQVRGAWTARAGDPAVLAISCFGGGPLGFSTREHLIDRVHATARHWERWSGPCAYDGPWRDAVVRSALALDLLVDDDTSAIVAAPTVGLPERVGGPRNYDYRYAWLRDANLTLEAMLRLGYSEQVHASVAWMLAATRRPHPLLRPIHRLDGTPSLPDEELDLAGYRGSRPVVLGNSAQDQLQLGTYGDVFDTVWHYVEAGNGLDGPSGERLAELADSVCSIWRDTDSGLWELGNREHYTQSKLACWLALERAGQLAELGELPGGGARRWRDEQERIRAYVERECWSDELGAYTRAAGSGELDAAVLLPARGAFIARQPERLRRRWTPCASISAQAARCCTATPACETRRAPSSRAHSGWSRCSRAWVASRRRTTPWASSWRWPTTWACTRRRSIRRRWSSWATCRRRSRIWRCSTPPTCSPPPRERVPLPRLTPRAAATRSARTTAARASRRRRRFAESSAVLGCPAVDNNRAMECCAAFAHAYRSPLCAS